VADEIRSMIAVSAAKHNIALQNLAPVAKLWLSTNTTYAADGVSAGSIMQILMNVYTHVLMCMSEKVAKSEHIAIAIDGTSDVRERNPIAIRMTGEFSSPFSLLSLFSLFSCPLISSPQVFVRRTGGHSHCNSVSLVIIKQVHNSGKSSKC